MFDYTRVFQRISRMHGMVPYRLGRGYALPPLHLLVEVTYRCNLSCEMCQFFQFMDDDAPGKPKREELKAGEIFNALEGLPGFTLVTFTGGELFVRKDMMEILEWASAKRRTSIITNGTMIGGERAEKLVNLAPRSLFGKGLILVNVSLEGGEETHDGIAGMKGAFGKTVTALERLADARRKAGTKYPLLNMKTVITHRNVSELGYLYGLARDLGMDIFNPMIMSYIDVHPQRLQGTSASLADGRPVMRESLDTGLLKAKLDEITGMQRAGNGPQIRLTPPEMPVAEMVRYYSGELDIADYNCYSPWSVAALSAYGEVTVCPYYSMGNVREQSFKRIWNGPEMVRFRNQIKKAGIFKGCLGCCSMNYTGGAHSPS